MASTLHKPQSTVGKKQSKAEPSSCCGRTHILSDLTEADFKCSDNVFWRDRWPDSVRQYCCPDPTELNKDPTAARVQEGKCTTCTVFFFQFSCQSLIVL